jgi:(p)ppGpp synthase/HD superfamily hydrolase
MPAMMEVVLISTDRLSEAFAYAERLHRKQTRKGNDIPYVAHLMAVCATVLEWGGDEDVAIAALLHDAVEDQGGLDTLNEIRRRFGERVAEIVAGCSDSMTADKAVKAPWQERKESTVQKLRNAGLDIALVTAADKLHNLSALVRDVRRDGPATMSRFNAAPDRIVWYHAAVADALDRHRERIPVSEIERTNAELATLLGVSP